MSAFSASFHLDPQLSAPLYRQIYQRFKQAIMQNQLQAGERVPSARSLASELGVARATVDNAYGLLMAEGFLQSRAQAGTRVSLSLPALAPLPERIPEPPRFTVNPMLPASRPFPLELGLPALDAFPRAIWSRIVARQIRHTRVEDLGHAPLNGEAVLRHEVAAYLQLSRGFSCRPEQVFICAGYAAILDLVMGSLMRPQDGVWLEDPGYPVTQAFFRAAGATPIGIPVDAEGMDIGYAIGHFPQAKFAVVTPAHQSPMGVSLSLSRRMALLDWAANHQSWIIEDDYDSEFRYQGQPLPSLKSLDTQGRVIYAGTFSKVMFPALRLGYVVVPENLVDSVSDYCHLRACASPRLMQTSVAEFIAQGHFYRHLKRMRQLYVERRAFLTHALVARFSSALLWVNPQAGGIQLCANLASEYDDAAIARHARSQGLAIQALSDWQVETREKGSPFRPNGLLMGFPNIATQEQADKLCERLAMVMRESAERKGN